MSGSHRKNCLQQFHNFLHHRATLSSSFSTSQKSEPSPDGRRKRGTRDEYLELFAERDGKKGGTPGSAQQQQQKNRHETKAFPRAKDSSHGNASSSARFLEKRSSSTSNLKLSRTESHKLRITTASKFRNPHMASPSHKRHAFYRHIASLAKKGNHNALEAIIHNSSPELIFSRFGDISNVIDSATDESLMAYYVLALVNANRTSSAEAFILDRFKTRISPQGYLVALQPYLFCNLIKGYAKMGNVDKVRQWISILQEEVPYQSDSYKSLVIGFNIMALARANRINEALTYFRDVVHDYAPQYNEALERELQEEEEEEKENQGGSTPGRKIKKASILTAKSVTPLMQALISQRRVAEVHEIYSQAVMYGDNVANDINIHNILMDAHVRVGDEKGVLNILGTYFTFKSTAAHSSIVEALQQPTIYAEKSNATRKRKSGLFPNEYTLMVLMRLWAARGDVVAVEKFYNLFLQHRPHLQLTGKADSMRIYARVRSGNVDEARALFDELYETPLRDSSDEYHRNSVPNLRSNPSDDDKLPQKFTPNEDVYAFLLYGYAKQSDVTTIRHLLWCMQSSKLRLTKLTINSLLRGLIENGDIENARTVFHDYCANPTSINYVHPDYLTFNLIMRGFAQRGDVSKVEHLMGVMKDYRLAPNEDSFAALLEAHIHAKDVPLEDAIGHLMRICEERIRDDNRVSTYRNVAQIIAQQGNVEMVQLLVNRLVPEVVTNRDDRVELQNALLFAHVRRSDSWPEVFAAFQNLFTNPFSLLASSQGGEKQEEPNSSTYLILLRRLSREEKLPENLHLKALFTKEFETLSGQTGATSDSFGEVDELLKDEDVDEMV
eukprot:CAMPEP_0117453532 /NCGR_PEP_ID=MMETSP0759-20121206/10275_1 /TAXON_ID=63605 /ORGANISM="Percolomonas cosmopolitus, Strain WS" /LENGTH=838 /DNA_ID=CAMNT_0005246573 /DNA_START=190 /DNA_END=2706 /DNA_ORIENTATION=-